MEVFFKVVHKNTPVESWKNHAFAGAWLKAELTTNQKLPHKNHVKNQDFKKQTFLTDWYIYIYTHSKKQVHGE